MARQKGKKQRKQAAKLPAAPAGVSVDPGGGSNSGVYIAGAQRSLTALFRVRQSETLWADQEVEAQSESLAYKTGEALDAFFRFYSLLPKAYPREDLGSEAAEILLNDFRTWLGDVSGRGFVPSPYYFNLEPWQSTEFASFAIGLCRNAHHFFSAYNSLDKGLREGIHGVVGRAIAFLRESCLHSQDGMSWSVGEKPALKGSERSDVCSTSRVVVALSAAQGYRGLFDGMKPDDREFTRQGIEEGCQWILRTLAGNVFEEYPGGGFRELGITLTALEALASAPPESFSQPQRLRITPVIENLIAATRSGPDALNRKFFIAAEVGSGQGVYLDLRWSWSSALIGLSSIHEWVKNQARLERDYYLLLSRLHAKVWAARDGDTDLWEAGSFGVGDTYRGIIATLLYSIHGRPRTFSFTEGQLREAIQDSAVSEAVFHAVLRALDRMQNDPSIATSLSPNGEQQ